MAESAHDFDRTRSLDGWRCRKFRWGSLEEFLRAPLVGEGIHSIPVGGLLLDIFIEIVPGAPALVHLHGNTPRDPSFHLPALGGFSVTGHLTVTRIIPSDPALLLHDQLTLGWHAGTSDVPLQEVYRKVFDRVFELASPSLKVFWGGSGGGFASLFYSHFYEGSVALAFNPQTDILKYSHMAVDDYLRLGFGIEPGGDYPGALEGRIVYDLAPLYAGGHGNRVLYLQNLTDWHVHVHLKGLLDAMDPEGRLDLSKPFNGLAAKDFYLFLDEYSEEHSPPSPAEIASCLTHLVKGGPGAEAFDFAAFWTGHHRRGEMPRWLLGEAAAALGRLDPADLGEGEALSNPQDIMGTLARAQALIAFTCAGTGGESQTALLDELAGCGGRLLGALKSLLKGPQPGEFAGRALATLWDAADLIADSRAALGLSGGQSRFLHALSIILAGVGPAAKRFADLCEGAKAVSASPRGEVPEPPPKAEEDSMTVAQGENSVDPGPTGAVDRPRAGTLFTLAQTRPEDMDPGAMGMDETSVLCRREADELAFEARIRKIGEELGDCNLLLVREAIAARQAKLSLTQLTRKLADLESKQDARDQEVKSLQAQLKAVRAVPPAPPTQAGPSPERVSPPASAAPAGVGEGENLGLVFGDLFQKIMDQSRDLRGELGKTVEKIEKSNREAGLAAQSRD